METLPAMSVLVEYGSDLLLVLTCAVGAGTLVAAILALSLAAHSPRWSAARATCASAARALVRRSSRSAAHR